MAQLQGQPNRRQRRVAAQRASKRAKSTEAGEFQEIWDMEETRARRLQRNREQKERAEAKFVSRVGGKIFGQLQESDVNDIKRYRFVIWVEKAVQSASRDRASILLLCVMALVVWCTYLDLGGLRSCATRMLLALPMRLHRLQSNIRLNQKYWLDVNNSRMITDKEEKLLIQRLGIAMGDTKRLIGM